MISKLLRSEKLLALTMIAWVSMVFLPNAEANFFDFFQRIMGKTEAVVFTATDSAKAPVLQAPLNSNPLAGVGGGDIAIIQSSALLPVTGPLGSIADIEEKKSESISIYVVRPGDTIGSIAELFGVSSNTIAWANEIKKGSLISPGQILVVLPVTGVQYKVQKGDTLAGIAKKFGGDAEEILNFNGLTTGVSLTEGLALIIPNGEAPTVPKSAPNSSGSKIANGAQGVEYKGYYIRPFIGGVKTQGIHGYNGVDLANSCGTPMLASATGDVIVAKQAGWNGGYGQYIAISHPNGTQTLYAHMSKIIVGQGWHVVQGQVIGYVGSSGNSTGCHVHFEIRGAKNPF